MRIKYPKQARTSVAEKTAFSGRQRQIREEHVQMSKNSSILSNDKMGEDVEK